MAGLQAAAPSSAATGSMVVTSTPAGGQVFVDNQFRGVAPVTIYNVMAGTHVINLQLSGYSDWSTSVDVPANQVVQVPAALVPVTSTAPVPTRAGLSLTVPLSALAAGAIVMIAGKRKYC